MDWVVGILLLVVGGVIGFFAAKYFFSVKNIAPNTEQTEKTIKEIMAQQAAEHLEASRNTLQSLRQQCDALGVQLDSYQALLSAQSQDSSAQQLSYFGEHASLYLRNKQAQQKRQKSSADFQPRDFSAESSGLFSGSKSDQTEKQ